MAQELQALTTEEARTVFAALPPELQAAMKAAGKTEGWTPSFWRREVALIHQSLSASGFSPAVLAAALALYRETAP